MTVAGVAGRGVVDGAARSRVGLHEVVGRDSRPSLQTMAGRHGDLPERRVHFRNREHLQGHPLHDGEPQCADPVLAVATGGHASSDDELTATGRRFAERPAQQRRPDPLPAQLRQDPNVDDNAVVVVRLRQLRDSETHHAISPACHPDPLPAHAWRNGPQPAHERVVVRLLRVGPVHCERGDRQVVLTAEIRFRGFVQIEGRDVDSRHALSFTAVSAARGQVAFRPGPCPAGVSRNRRRDAFMLVTKASRVWSGMRSRDR